MSHYFKSLEQLDAYWKHLVRAYHGWFETLPMFLYSPYHIWFYVPGRRSSEENFYRSFKDKNIHAYYQLGNDSVASQDFRKDYRDEYFHVEIGKLAGIRETEHITVVGDLYITTKLPKSVSGKIESIFNKTDGSGIMFEKEIKEILSQKMNTSIHVERNSQKTKKFMKRMEEYFVITMDTKNMIEDFLGGC